MINPLSRKLRPLGTSISLSIACSRFPFLSPYLSLCVCLAFGWGGRRTAGSSGSPLTTYRSAPSVLMMAGCSDNRQVCTTFLGISLSTQTRVHVASGRGATTGLPHMAWPVLAVCTVSMLIRPLANRSPHRAVNRRLCLASH